MHPLPHRAPAPPRGAGHHNARVGGFLRRHARTGERAGRPRLLPPERTWRTGRLCRSCWDREWARRGSRRGARAGAPPHFAAQSTAVGLSKGEKKKSALFFKTRPHRAHALRRRTARCLKWAGMLPPRAATPCLCRRLRCAPSPRRFFSSFFLPRAPSLYFLPVRPGGFFFFAVPTHVPPGLRRGLHGLPNTGAVLRLNSRRVTRWESSAALLLPHPSSSPTTHPPTHSPPPPSPLFLSLSHPHTSLQLEAMFKAFGQPVMPSQEPNYQIPQGEAWYDFCVGRVSFFIFLFSWSPRGCAV
jgi:hypothetical protein